MPQNVQSKATDEQQATLEAAQGLSVDAQDPRVLARAIELAVDYRGDVAVSVAGEPEPVAGFVFDRKPGPSPAESHLRIIPADGSPRRTIAYGEITQLAFTGRDTAAGKSFDTWMRKYVQKKLAGEEASIHEATHESSD